MNFQLFLISKQNIKKELQQKTKHILTRIKQFQNITNLFNNLSTSETCSKRTTHIHTIEQYQFRCKENIFKRSNTYPNTIHHQQQTQITNYQTKQPTANKQQTTNTAKHNIKHNRKHNRKQQITLRKTQLQKQHQKQTTTRSFNQTASVTKALTHRQAANSQQQQSTTNNKQHLYTYICFRNIVILLFGAGFLSFQQVLIPAHRFICLSMFFMIVQPIYVR